MNNRVNDGFIYGLGVYSGSGSIAQGIFSGIFFGVLCYGLDRLVDYIRSKRK